MKLCAIVNNEDSDYCVNVTGWSASSSIHDAHTWISASEVNQGTRESIEQGIDEEVSIHLKGHTDDRQVRYWLKAIAGVK